MLSYNDLYETLRKEKYSETLQALPKEFIKEFSDYLSDKKEESSKDDSLFMDATAKSKKQFENSIAIFKELMLRRKKKLLNLVFVATETGIMKRDYENMLIVERDVFDKLVKNFEDVDKNITKLLQGKSEKEVEANKMILFNQNVEQFIDMSGQPVGPFSAGELANLDTNISAILVSGGKASFVDEN